jgi:hypothetical protein
MFALAHRGAPLRVLLADELRELLRRSAERRAAVLVSFAFISRVPSALFASALRRSTIACGVPAGATSPLHVAASKPG